MPRLKVAVDVDAWFAENGWSPGRSAVEQASAFVAEAVEESRRCGFPVVPFPEVFVIDERGRFFCMHHTGDYSMGTGKHEAMIGLYDSPMQDAEDFYV
ncbi:SUKH-3 domain-containing protein [Streptomyces sp. NPDC015130]|uniref:SUKH-3 domain-containing protein n=1 Tax=Streptomyces sp. NPDC015130 TaxID=3364940 RepID=UPI0036FF6ED1